MGIDEAQQCSAGCKMTSSFVNIYFVCVRACVSLDVYSSNTLGSKKVKNTERELQTGLESKDKSTQVDRGHGSF